MFKRILLTLLVLAFAAMPALAATSTLDLGLDIQPHEGVDVELVVFLFDKCGGCGTDNPGCGNCKEMVKFHGIIKESLGDRLYDGTIYYAMHNCRIELNDAMYDEYFKRYGISEDLYGYRPAAFIGTPDGGLYLLGEQMLPYVQKYIDKYLEGGDLEAVQEEINAERLAEIEKFYGSEEYSD